MSAKPGDLYRCPICGDGTDNFPNHMVAEHTTDELRVALRTTNAERRHAQLLAELTEDDAAAGLLDTRIPQPRTEA